MSIKSYIATSLLLSLFYSSNALSSPASTEYVKSSIDALRNELTTQLNLVKSGIGTVQTQVNSLPIITHKIGDIVQGGLVFWVDASQQHGLIVSLGDLNGQEGIEWRNGEGGDRSVNAKAKGLGSGEQNTRLIIAEQTIDQQEGQFAALIAANYQISADGVTPCPTTITTSLACYGGWYLPSVYELMLLHTNLKSTNLGQLTDELYWSSTEDNTTQAWLIDFSTGTPEVREKSTPAHVRAIHTF